MYSLMSKLEFCSTLIIFRLLEEYKFIPIYCSTKISIIIPFIRYNKVISLHKPERYNILEVNDYAD